MFLCHRGGCFRRCQLQFWSILSGIIVVSDYFNPSFFSKWGGFCLGIELFGSVHSAIGVGLS